ncbi:S8 family peptidase [Congregicoccus parvus]|uniref:S8 family peptidase n=1 Tax=Congregicoccus parvus TaxID=3081749 RepID=UPI003FA5AA62
MRVLCATLVIAGVLAALLLGSSSAHAAPVVSGRILARLKPAVMAAQNDQPAALAHAGVTVSRRSYLVPGLVVIDAAPGMVASTTMDAASATVFQRIAQLRSTGLFEYVEPDYIVAPQLAPTDEAFTDGRHWNLHNTGQDGGLAGVDIDAVRAWDIMTGSPDVVVAVIDSGIRYTHHDLASQMWRNPAEIPGNGIDDDGNGYIDDVYGIDAITGSGDPSDDLGHGTLVAGIIGAAANNGHPAVGVCWNVRLMACRFISAEGSGSNSAAIECIEYAVKHGARVINASWGGADYSQALADAIRAAGEHDVIFVASAGNDLPGHNTDLRPSHPASTDADSIVSVTGIMRDGNVDRHSNFGSESVDLGAPTFDIFSTSVASDVGYDYIGGTSAAAPHVSAVAALLLSQDSERTIWQVRDRLLGSTVAMPSLLDKSVTGGRISAYEALSIPPDGTLELSLQRASGGVVFSGRIAVVEARVTDVDGVTGASVTGAVSGSRSLTFADDGVAPDRVAGDANYTASFVVPLDVNELEVTVEANAEGYVPVQRTVTWTVLVPPANDHFANRENLGAFEYNSRTRSNAGATREPVEPIPAAEAGAGGGRSLWWTWTAPRSGRVAIHTRGSDLDTILGVYTGDSLAALVEIASNDDVGAAGALWSHVDFEAVAGTVYQIVVDGFGGDAGTAVVTVVMPPENDAFADRVRIGGASVSADGRLSGATREPEEPHLGARGNTVWWTWHAPSDGLATIEFPEHTANGGVVVGVFTGETLSGLTQVASNIAALFESGRESLAFLARSGVDYHITVDSVDAIGLPLEGLGAFTMTIELETLRARNETSTNIAGGELMLHAAAGDIEGATYQWRRDGNDIPGATGASFVLPSVQLFDAGLYSVVVTQGDAVIVSESVEVVIEPPVSSGGRLTNLSTRAVGGSGESTLIPGFVLGGPGARSVLLRAIGPQLAEFGVSGVLGDPRMTLKRRSGNVWIDVAANKDWGDNANAIEIQETSRRLGAFELVEGGRDAALLLKLEAGEFSVLVNGADESAGIAMMEVYDAGDEEADARVMNLSNRGFVGTGGEIMIPGLVVSAEGAKSFLIRAVGPGLEHWGVGDVLTDPELLIYRQAGEGTGSELILSNDNWGENGDAARIEEAAAQVGAFSLLTGSSDAAFVVTLAPGVYTAHVRGVGGSTGVALVEIYDVQ